MVNNSTDRYKKSLKIPNGLIRSLKSKDRQHNGNLYNTTQKIKVITKLPNSEQSYKGKVKTHNYINRQNQSTTGKL